MAAEVVLATRVVETVSQLESTLKGGNTETRPLIERNDDLIEQQRFPQLLADEKMSGQSKTCKESIDLKLIYATNFFNNCLETILISLRKLNEPGGFSLYCEIPTICPQIVVRGFI